MTRVRHPSQSGRALEEILPANASVAATGADIADAALHPEEAVAVERAVEGRRREFATGRACARIALGRWGLSDRAVPVGPGGAPQWPPGIVGSITHCDGYRACAVARAEDLASIGIDAEPDEPLRDAVLSVIATRRERTRVAALLAEAPGVRWDRLLFCMKEAAYKAWFPLAGLRFGLRSVAISIDPSSGSFTARPLLAGARIERLWPPGSRGRWNVRDGIALAAVAIPARAASERSVPAP